MTVTIGHFGAASRPAGGNSAATKTANAAREHSAFTDLLHGKPARRDGTAVQASRQDASFASQGAHAADERPSAHAAHGQTRQHAAEFHAAAPANDDDSAGDRKAGKNDDGPRNDAARPMHGRLPLLGTPEDLERLPLAAAGESRTQKTLLDGTASKDSQASGAPHRHAPPAVGPKVALADEKDLPAASPQPVPAADRPLARHASRPVADVIDPSAGEQAPSVPAEKPAVGNSAGGIADDRLAVDQTVERETPAKHPDPTAADAENIPPPAIAPAEFRLLAQPRMDKAPDGPKGKSSAGPNTASPVSAKSVSTAPGHSTPAGAMVDAVVATAGSRRGGPTVGEIPTHPEQSAGSATTGKAASGPAATAPARAAVTAHAAPPRNSENKVSDKRSAAVERPTAPSAPHPAQGQAANAQADIRRPDQPVAGGAATPSVHPGEPPSLHAARGDPDARIAAPAKDRADPDAQPAGARAVVSSNQSFPAPAAHPVSATTTGLIDVIAAAGSPQKAAATHGVPLPAPATVAVPTQVLKIELHPAELGTVIASLRLAGAQLSVELKPATHEAYRRLSNDSDIIAKSLKTLGLDVDKVTVLQPSIATTPTTRGDAAGMASPQPGRDQSSSAAGGSGGNGDGTGGQQSGRNRNHDGQGPERGAPVHRERAGGTLFI